MHMDDAEFEDRFWTACGKHGTGFLTLEGVAGAKPHPMTASPNREEDRLYFFTRAGNSLVPPAAGAPGVFYYANDGLYARVSGDVSLCEDPAKKAELWSGAVERWLPEGKDSPAAVLLQLQPSEATIWIESEGGVAQFLSGTLGQRRPEDQHATVAL